LSIVSYSPKATISNPDLDDNKLVVLSDKVKEATLAQIPMKRFGNTSEVAEVATFLARQEYLTGQVIAIDGGLAM